MKKMPEQLPYHIKLFNDRVRTMNQTNAKLLTLNADEARNLHTEIYNLLASMTELSFNPQKPEEIIQIKMDGGSFK
jgi:hypothetical protein